MSKKFEHAPSHEHQMLSYKGQVQLWLTVLFIMPSTKRPSSSTDSPASKRRRTQLTVSDKKSICHNSVSFHPISPRFGQNIDETLWNGFQYPNTPYIRTFKPHSPFCSLTGVWLYIPYLQLVFTVEKFTCWFLEC